MHRRLGPAAERLPELREALKPPRLQARHGERWLLARERALEHRGRQGRVSQQRLEHLAQQVVLVLSGGGGAGARPRRDRSEERRVGKEWRARWSGER